MSAVIYVNLIVLPICQNTLTTYINYVSAHLLLQVSYSEAKVAAFSLQ